MFNLFLDTDKKIVNEAFKRIEKYKKENNVVDFFTYREEGDYYPRSLNQWFIIPKNILVSSKSFMREYTQMDKDMQKEFFESVKEIKELEYVLQNNKIKLYRYIAKLLGEDARWNI